MNTRTNPILWQPAPDRLHQTHMMTFMKRIHERYPQVSIWDETASLTDNYAKLYQWSITDIESFWREIWDYCKVKSTHIGISTMTSLEKMPGAKWFPEARLNFAENLLYAADQTEAIVFCAEGQFVRRLSRAEIATQTAAIAAALRDLGVKEGDHVAAYMPNIPETLIFMLAATSIGAVFSSISPDFGVQGVMDRLSQVEPKVLLTTQGYFYNGKTIDILDKVIEVSHRLRQNHGLQKTIVVSYTGDQENLAGIAQAEHWDTLQNSYRGALMTFAQLPFDHPLYIMFSSGTTGVPKCILHTAGGVLLQHLKEHQLHTDLHNDDRLFYFTTCGWMMWNWLVSGLATRATLLLYEGSPMYQQGRCLFDFIASERCSHFGTSAKFIDAMAKNHLQPNKTHDLEALRVILSTGSPLSGESFDYVYQHIKTDVCLSSIAGGTDLLSCFVLGNPLLPVRRGEIQCRGLGMAVDIFNDQGKAIVETAGELVCTKPFPSMPIGFLNDPEGQRYHETYFSMYPNIWAHNDYCQLTHEGGLIVHGRSDTTLNPGGVRIGTSEIYRQVETLNEVLESIVIGQMWQGDERVVLFVRLRENLTLDDGLRQKIVKKIRDNTTPRHVPALILQIHDIPRTRSGKIVELAVKNIVHHRPVHNIESLANPEALKAFSEIPELKSV